MRIATLTAHLSADAAVDVSTDWRVDLDHDMEVDICSWTYFLALHMHDTLRSVHMLDKIWENDCDVLHGTRM